MTAQPTATSATSAQADLTGTYTLDPAHTRIGFVARHAMVTKVRGQFNEFEGHAHVDFTDASKCSAEVKIATTSIEKIAPLSLSLVGRTASPGGAVSCTPRARPAITRTRSLPSAD